MPNFPHHTEALMEMPHCNNADVRDAILASKSSYSCGPYGYPQNF